MVIVKNYLQSKFENLTKGTKYVTSLITNQLVDTPFRDSDIESLLKYHPSEEKIKDIEYLIVKIRPPYNRKALYIKNRCDESEEDVSYKYCLRVLFGKYNEDENNVNRIVRAFRDVISHTKKKDYFLDYRDNICQQCNKETDNLHIDHYRYTFQRILDEFIFNNNISFSSIKVFENTNNEHEFNDNNLQSKWIDYHDNNAVFKALCVRCNLTNGTYGYKKNKKLYDTCIK
jgi:hypothetical protein